MTNEEGSVRNCWSWCSIGLRVGGGIANRHQHDDQHDAHVRLDCDDFHDHNVSQAVHFLPAYQKGLPSRSD